MLSGSGTAFGGAKLGFGPVVLSLGYDRIQAQHGFSADLSGMIPVVRFPGAQIDDNKNFVRVYAQPGLGYRAGPGPFGGYFSAKAMVAFLSTDRLSGDAWKGSPFLEVERRFPFKGLGQGDTRVSLGYVFIISDHSIQ